MPGLENEPGGRPECAAGSWKEESMGDVGGEGKRGEGGRVGGDCDGERHCPKGTFLGKLSQENKKYMNPCNTICKIR